MEVTNLVPDTGAIPLPWGWFEALSILTLVLHLLMMNALVGGTVITLVQKFRSKGENLIGKSLSKKLPVLIAFTVNMGIAPLLFVQVLYGGFIYTSQILMAYYALGIIALVIIGYYCLYIYRFKMEAGKDSSWPLIMALITILSTGFIFVNIMTMMLNPGQWTAYFQQANGSVLAVGDATFWPKFLHMINGALAIGGLFVALVWQLKGKDSEGREENIKLGMNWFFYPTLLQLVIGTWFLFTLPGEVLKTFMGGNIFATLLLAIAIVSALLALYFSYKKQVFTTIALALLTLVLMVVTRAFMRASYLGQVNYSPGNLPVAGDLSPFILFAATLVVGLVITGWMLLTYAKVERKEA